MQWFVDDGVCKHEGEVLLEVKRGGREKEKEREREAIGFFMFGWSPPHLDLERPKLYWARLVIR